MRSTNFIYNSKNIQSTPTSCVAVAILIHGLYGFDWQMRFIKKKLEEAGICCACFSYKSTRYSTQTLTDLSRYIQHILKVQNISKTTPVFLIGHSMGGLISMRYCKFPNIPNPLGCVTITCPHQGSIVGRFAQDIGLLGSAGKSGITTTFEWSADVPLLNIVGNHNRRFGPLNYLHNKKIVSLFYTCARKIHNQCTDVSLRSYVAAISQFHNHPSDGTIYCFEAQCPLTANTKCPVEEHILAVSHFSSLYSKTVCGILLSFIDNFIRTYDYTSEVSLTK